jgi:hypothetical protein
MHLILLTTALALASSGPPPSALDFVTAEAVAVCVGAIAEVARIASAPEGSSPRFEATFSTVRSLKGDCPTRATLAFDGPNPNVMAPRFDGFTLEAGATYLLFLTPGADGRWSFTRDQLPIRSAPFRLNPTAAGGPNVHEVVWRSLTADLGSSDPDTVERSVQALDGLSGAFFSVGQTPADFNRRVVTDRVMPLLESNDPRLVDAALPFLGRLSPIVDDNAMVYWLEGLRPGSFPGVGGRDPRRAVNFAAVDHFDAIASFADRGSPDERAFVVRFLAGSGRKDILPSVDRWLADPSPRVRASATLLLPDLSPEERAVRLAVSAGDASPEVRAAAANAVAFAQDSTDLPTIEGLLSDDVAKVRMAAARALVAVGDADALARHVDDPVYGGLFVNTLAEADPSPWVDRLVALVRDRYHPNPWWGGRDPAADSWSLLFRFATRQGGATLGSAAFAPILDALEGAPYWDSSAPRDLYQLYRRNGLDVRADAFRASCLAANPMYTQFFDQVDGH